MTPKPPPPPYRRLTPGIYAPTQVFFHEDTDDLDIETVKIHTLRLARAGVAGIVTNGSNGEAVYLSPEERTAVTVATRQCLDDHGFNHLPIIAGASDQSVRATAEMCRDASSAGADAVLAMVPSFFRWAMANPAAVEAFFVQVADASPLPVIIYNYPGAAAGIDLDSDLLCRLASHPNIVGTKFTCGNVGKLARVAAATFPVSDVSYHKADQKKPNQSGPSPSAYMAFAGIADFITPSLAVGSSGAIVGAANVFPRACVRVYRLFVEGRHAEAMEAQRQLAAADWSLTKRAIPGFKAILRRHHGYGGRPRQPMQALSDREAGELLAELTVMMEFEQGLPDVA